MSVSVGRKLYVQDLPSLTTSENLHEVFSKCGTLLSCFVVPDKAKGQPCKGYGFVTYMVKNDADKALETIKDLNGKLIRVSHAKSTKKEKTKSKDGTNDDKLQDSRDKHGHLIVRNLSFKVTEELLGKEFGKFGKISRVKVPTKPDGKMRGFGIVEFESKMAAQKALNQMNMAKILERPVAVDWCYPKAQYEAAKKEEVSDEIQMNVTDEGPSTKQMKQTEDVEEGSDEDDQEDDESEGDDDEEEESGSDDPNSEADYDDDEDGGPPKKKMKTEDAEDGRTLFVRNLAYDTSQESIRDLFGEYGRLQYALLCKEKISQQPIGTAFVRYLQQEDAEKCLRAFDEDPSTFTLQGRELKVCYAKTQNSVKKILDKKKEEKTAKKDNRNLFLMREGVIFPGSKAAEGVSKHDIALREQLQKWKQDALRNVNMFISPFRLYVNNLPPDFDDKQLRIVFSKAGGPTSKVTEARVMKNLKDPNGLAPSKGYGFVTFTDHAHALKALRTINNNPNIFKIKNRRPIVEFSVENHVALNAKKRRKEMSQQVKVTRDEHETNSRKMQNERTQFQGATTAKTPKHLKEQAPKKLTRNFFKKTRSMKRKTKKAKREAEANTRPKVRREPRMNTVAKPSVLKRWYED